MHKNKIIILFNSLNINELSLFEQHLKSSLSNGGKLVLLLFNQLKKNHPFFKLKYKKKLNKSHVFLKIWPGEVYNSKRFSKLLGKLYVELENFISIQYVLNNEAIKRSILVNNKCVQQHRNVFINNAKKLEKELTKKKECSKKYYELMRFYELNFEFAQTDNYSSENKDYLAINEYFDLFCYSSKLKIYCEKYSQNQMFTTVSIQPQDVTNLLLQTQKYTTQQYPLLHIYHAFLDFLHSKQDKSVFLQILSLAKSYSTVFQEKELKDLFLTLGKFCTQQRMNGNEYFLDTHLELYIWALDENIIPTDKSIAGANFLNIVFLALAVKDIRYAVDFIRKNRSKIPKEEERNVLLFCLAQYKFTIGEFEKAFYFIEKTSLHLEHYRLRKQYMLIRIYYEYFVQQPNKMRLKVLESKIASCFEFFKAEQTISEGRRQQFHDLIWFIRKLKTAHFKQKKAVKAQLLGKIATKDILLKAWLIAKIKELP